MKYKYTLILILVSLIVAIVYIITGVVVGDMLVIVLSYGNILDIIAGLVITALLLVLCSIMGFCLYYLWRHNNED